MKSFFKKAAPHIIKYRDYKTFDERLFRNELRENLGDISDTELNYDVFENISQTYKQYAPMKETCASKQFPFNVLDFETNTSKPHGNK